MTIHSLVVTAVFGFDCKALLEGKKIYFQKRQKYFSSPIHSIDSLLSVSSRNTSSSELLPLTFFHAAAGYKPPPLDYCNLVAKLFRNVEHVG